MRRSGHRVRTDIAGSKVLRAHHYTRPQVHRWIRTIPNGFADRSDHQILRTKWTVFESNELLRCFKPPLLRVSLLSGSPQRDSNPYLHLERVATYPVSRWGDDSSDGARTRHFSLERAVSLPIRRRSHMGHPGFEPGSYGLRVRCSAVILMTRSSPHRI